ncbi:MAG: hypothetical protein P8J59_04005 [Phycisphaerales bacterium]|jgi:hypothetical protein|nr:hypothetical protein [Phycisphaerales bacterium]
MTGIAEGYESIRYRIEQFISGRERTVATASIATVVGVLLVLIVVWWMGSRWRPPPSIFDSPVDDVLGYLALDDFNSLSLEERMRYLTEFAGRFQGFAQEESASAAAFLAGITGPTREQMRQNARILVKDVLLEGAEGYFAVSEADRGKFLDEWMAGWQRKAEEMIGQGGDARSDDERAAEIRADARQDMTRERDTDRIPDLDGKAAERFIGFWQSDVDSASTPREQGQIIRFLDDLRVHLAKPPGA